MQIRFGLAEIEQVAAQFLEAIGDRTLIAFYAEMGVGKTTFIKALCKQMGVDEDEVNSPTFSIVNEYETTQGDLFYHFDFYRIKDPQEAIDFGLYDYFDSDRLCLMEWPEEVEPILPDDVLRVSIQEEADGTRLLRIL